MIPVLFYTEKRNPYLYPSRRLDEFDNPAVAEKLYGSAFPLTDITVIPDDDIMNLRSMAALTLLQKHLHQRDMIFCSFHSETKYSIHKCVGSG